MLTGAVSEDTHGSAVSKVPQCVEQYSALFGQGIVAMLPGGKDPKAFMSSFHAHAMGMEPCTLSSVTSRTWWNGTMGCACSMRSAPISTKFL